ncbi:phospholipase D-like domain-containing protein [Maritimibacter dapengensis]|uniref:Phospholipase D n=1 Tax=Maritimibacter dapengensis TaxID=2836868 RepID=A0ABS6SYY6_9RHOB|nr:phospholipase D-like domain-containing protein [Maritimibacter dapengensis]MBV7378187.1 phospholipase [Maritimibacter dapengensis]
MHPERPRFLLTAEEAYPEFERLVLDAREEVVISMRIFDPRTHLKSHAGREIGTTWSDLITHKMNEGVRFFILITDFDPVARPDLHKYSWDCLLEVRTAAAASDHPDRMEAQVHMHPARVSWGHRVMFYPLTRSKLRDACDELNVLPEAECAEALAEMPALRPLVTGRPPHYRPRVWPPAPLVPATHHQKMAVIDETWVYLGGLDLNPRRYDDKAHIRDPEKTWHDVQVIVGGEIAKEARRHILDLTATSAGEAEPATTRHLLRTLSADPGPGNRALAPREVLREIEDTHLRMIKSAEQYIYIETQFLRSTSITQALTEAAKRAPELQLMVLLPAAPEDVAFDQSEDMDARFGEQLQSEAIDALRDAFGDRVFFGAPAQPRTAITPHRDTHYRAPIIYIHAKVMIVDGKEVIVSSANLNGRSLRWDTETAAAFADPEDADRLFKRCLSHWFVGRPVKDATKASTWHELAQENRDLKPEERPHFILPYDPEPAREMGVPVPGMPEEMV